MKRRPSIQRVAYLSSETGTDLGSLWHRFSQTGTRLLTRDHHSPVSSLVVEPFGTSYAVSGYPTNGTALIKMDVYGTIKWGSDYPNGVGNGTSRSFFDAQGNIVFIASGYRFLPGGGSVSFIRKVTPAGVTQSHVPLPLGLDEVIADAGRDKDGNFVALVEKYVGSDTYRTVRKFRSSDGAELWSKDISVNGSATMAMDGQGRTWVARRTSASTGILQRSQRWVP